MPNGAGWYVFAVENGRPPDLTDAEDKVVNEFRFGGHFEAGGKKPEGRV
jgi:hypothetical protein